MLYVNTRQVLPPELHNIYEVIQIYACSFCSEYSGCTVVYLSVWLCAVVQVWVLCVFSLFSIRGVVR